MNRPRVSVIVPVQRSDPDRLKKTLDSVLGQSYDNVEVVVVGDTADAKDIAGGYADKVKYLESEGGAAAALNLGIKKMTGQYFSWLSPGDTYSPVRIEELVKSLDTAHGTIPVSDWIAATGGGKKKRVQLSDRRLERYSGCFLAFASQPPLNTCAILAPKAALDGAEPFDGFLPPTQDYKMLARLVSAGASFKVVNQPLLSLAYRPPEELPVEPTAKEYDFVHSNIIDTLSYDAIVGYFGDDQQAIVHYKKVLGSGLPRTAAFLIAKIIKGSMAANGSDPTERLLLDDVSELPEAKMATDAGTLLSKIAQTKGKRRVLFSSAHWLTGGMERVMSTLFRELESDYEIFLITPYDQRKSHIDIPASVVSIKIADELFAKHFDSLILSYALLLDIDVVVGSINLFEKQLNFYTLCEGTKIKTIASNHEYYFYPYKSPVHYHIVEKRLSAFERCDALVWPTNFSAALCGMYVDNNYVIGNPNKFEVIGAARDVPREKMVLCVGRFDDYVKRIDRVLECFSLVLRRVPDAKLVLVGRHDKNAPIAPGDTTTVSDLLDKLAIPTDSIRFVGEVNNVHDYYAEARVLLLTSNSEGFGMVLNEAACFGVPSICNYIPGVEDIIADGENGFITQQGDIESMAARVCDVLSDDDSWRTLSENTRKRVVAYDPSHIGNKWRYLLDMLIKTKGHNGWRQKLNAELGYKAPASQLFMRVVSGELNDIFYHATGRSGQSEHVGGIPILSRIKRLPARLKANVEYEGWLKTGNKVVVRSYKVARNILKV